MEVKYGKRIIETMVPMDDVMFRLLAEHEEFLLELLRTVYHDPYLEIVEFQVQKEIKYLQWRGVRIDVLIRRSDGNLVAVEMQKSSEKDPFRRVRFVSDIASLYDTDEGTPYRDISDVDVIYITKLDFLRGKKCIYHVKPCIMETREVFEDGSGYILINAEIKDGSDLSELMTIYSEPDAYDYVRFPDTTKYKNYYKYDKKEEERISMSADEIIDELAEKKAQGIAQGIAQEIAQEKVEQLRCESAANLLRLGTVSREDIAGAIGLTLDKVNELAAQINL